MINFGAAKHSSNALVIIQLKRIFIQSIRSEPFSCTTRATTKDSPEHNWI